MFQTCQRFGLSCFFRRPLTGEFKWVTNAASTEKNDDLGNSVLKLEWKEGHVTQRHSWNESFKMSVRIQYRD